MPNFTGVVASDIDGTHFKKSLMLIALDFMFSHRLITKEDKWQLNNAKRKSQDLLDPFSYDDYLNVALKLFVERLVGVKEKEIKAIAGEICGKVGDNSFHFTTTLLKQKQQSGWFTCFISASLQSLVSAYGEYWGVNEAYGSIIKTVDGRYTVDRFALQGQAKADLFLQLLARPELARVEPENIWAIGDTVNDLPMLQIALEKGGTAICFNPDKALKEWGTANGAQLVFETKDYNLLLPENKSLLPFCL